MKPLATLWVWAVSGLCQSIPPQTIITVDIDNGLFYARDVTDYSRLATVAAPTPVMPARNFSFAEGLGDIVAVNGKPMRGAWHSRSHQVRMRPEPQQPGDAIADATATGTVNWIMDIRTPENQPIGIITGYGWNGGGPPLGTPRTDTGVNMVITGGTGAYVGIRGQMGYNADRQAAAPAYRGNASIAEDPRNRRVNGQGQTRRHVLQVFPMFVPEILGVMRAADGSPVTAVKPLGAGEQVMLLVSNLGPVRGGAMEPGQPFPAGPQYAQVNSPVSVLINGREVEAFNTIGWPGSSDQYRVDFVMPQGVAAGTATIQIQVAFLNGGTASIPVR